jgi:lactonase
MSLGNGVAPSPDGKDLWITEFGRNLLDRIELVDATTIAPFGSVTAYHFTGPAPDSMRADADGNFYVAMYAQGRVLVFNKNGIPIGQVLLPGRQEGHNLRSTSMAIRPGTNDLDIVSSDAGKGEGATIFHAKAFARLWFSTRNSECSDFLFFSQPQIPMGSELSSFTLTAVAR